MPLPRYVGKWTVIGPSIRRKNHILIQCRCSCGVSRFINKSALLNGKSNGCVKCTRTKQATGRNSPSWKGGRRLENGYVLVYDPSHPKAKKNGYVREHTKIMEAHLGRPLTRHESIHHINGNRSDNRIENLELWNTAQPFGQRVEDKVEWAINILKEYAPECLNLH